jgi:hypothetical protein
MLARHYDVIVTYCIVKLMFSRQRRGFSIAVLATLGFSALFGLVVLEPELFARVLGRETAGHISHHFREHQHRVHDLTFALLLGTAVVGLVAQLRDPRKVATQLMALMPFAGLILAVALTNGSVLSIPWVGLGASTLLATILHPAGRHLLSSLHVSRVNPLLLALVAIAAVPLLALASHDIQLQRTVSNDHAALGHYGFMAAFSFTAIGVGILASLRPDGWRLTAWGAGLLTAFLGVASLVFPDVESSLGRAWGLAAIAWGVAFAAAAELIRSRGRRAEESAPRVVLPGATTRWPTWVYVLGSGAIVVLALLMVLQHLMGGGPGRHS